MRLQQGWKQGDLGSLARQVQQVPRHMGWTKSWMTTKTAPELQGWRVDWSNRKKELLSCAVATSVAADNHGDQEDQQMGGDDIAIGRHARWGKLTAGVCLSCMLLTAMRGSSFGRFASMATVGVANPGINEAVKGAWAGLWAGTLHTLCGPDHLAGLTPLTLGQNQAIAAAMGALWGFGHSSGQLLLGLAFILLKERFHGLVPILSKWSGTIVGMTLITIGLLGIYESVFHQEEESPGGNAAFAGAQGANGSNVVVQRKKGLGTYIMGFMYGLHPDALFVVLPALALPTRLGAFSYIGMFVVGTVLAMGGYSFVIGTASEAAAKDRPWLLSHLSTVAGVLAICVGLFVLVTGWGFLFAAGA